MRRGKQKMMKCPFTFLALEIVTTDFCVTGFNGDPEGFNHGRIQSEYTQG